MYSCGSLAHTVANWEILLTVITDTWRSTHDFQTLFLLFLDCDFFFLVKWQLIDLQFICISYLCSHYRPVMWMLIVTDQHFILLITACLIIQSGHPSNPFNVCLVQTVLDFHAWSDATCFAVWRTHSRFKTVRLLFDWWKFGSYSLWPVFSEMRSNAIRVAIEKIKNYIKRKQYNRLAEEKSGKLSDWNAPELAQ